MLSVLIATVFSLLSPFQSVFSSHNFKNPSSQKTGICLYLHTMNICSISSELFWLTSATCVTLSWIPLFFFFLNSRQMLSSVFFNYFFGCSTLQAILTKLSNVEYGFIFYPSHKTLLEWSYSSLGLQIPLCSQ